MKVVKIDELIQTERDVRCPKGGFRSLRVLLESDGMGYSLTKTIVPKGEPQLWHYKHHLETCYCVSGLGVLNNLESGEMFVIRPDTIYVLDKHDRHQFMALEETVLICVFNPPLKGQEVHKEDGSY